MGASRASVWILRLATALAFTESAHADPASDLDGDWTTSTLTPYARTAAFKTLVVPEAQAAAYERRHRGKPPEGPEDAVGGNETDWWETDVGLARIRGGARSSWIISPADGRVPFTPAAVASNRARRVRGETDFSGPEVRPEGERCLSTVAPPMMYVGANGGFKIVQTPTDIVILIERSSAARVIRLGGARHGPATVLTRNGESIGWWEGATLVVDTRNISNATASAGPGEDRAGLRVIERITRTGKNELHYAFFISHPGRFIQPVQGEMVFQATSQPIFEVACHEGNYALTNILAGARAQDAAPPEP